MRCATCDGASAGSRKCLANSGWCSPKRMIVIEAIGIGGTGAQLLGIEEMFDAGGGMKSTRADKSAEPGIKAVGGVAATAQRIRQSALDAADGKPGDGVGKPAVGSH